MKMLGFCSQMNWKASSKLRGPWMISCFFVILTHFGLSMVPRFFAASSLLTLLPLAALLLLVVAGFGRFCRRRLGVYASAPAFVFFNILFIWAVYVAVVRQASNFCLVCSHFTFNGSCNEWGTCHAHRWFVQSSVTIRRVRYCGSCNAYIKGFDHHCPAFGNCIGHKNHVLFMFLLVGFIITETSYIFFCSQFATETWMLNKTGWKTSLSGNLAVSTMLFSLLQVLWQVVFLAWHIYCVCVNIKTDEWVNWKNYPEFQVIVPPQPGLSFTEMRFINPYNKGILCNLKEFLAPE